MAHTYAHVYGLPVTGLRFFTVYGPWGRPEMSCSSSPKDPQRGSNRRFQPRQSFTRFHLHRRYRPSRGAQLRPRGGAKPCLEWGRPRPGTSAAPYRLYNIGNNSPVALMDFIGCIERAVGKPANKNFLPMQAGDVLTTFADIETIRADFGFEPGRLGSEEGIAAVRGVVSRVLP